MKKREVKKLLKPVRAKDAYSLIVTLGGITAVAKATNVNKSTVSEHSRTGSIPPLYWPALIKLAAKKGYSLTADQLVSIVSKK